MGYLMPVVVVILIGANLFVLTAGDADVLIRLESYSNPEGTDRRGRCCDGWPRLCRYNCDYYFKLCLDEPRQSNRTRRCTYGSYRTEFDQAYENKRDVVFTEMIGGEKNPFQFVIPGTIDIMVTFKIEIKDHDKFSINDDVDFMRKDLWLHKGVYEEVKIPLHIVARTRLYSTVTLKCSTNWYGMDCGTYCAPPSMTDHYKCSTLGIPECEPGWTGSLCNHR